MNKHEVYYHVHKQELLAVREALQKFRCYLDGVAGCTVITDHDTLRHFFRERDLSTRQVRWQQVLATYQRQVDIVYKKGVVNHADALPRRLDMKNSLQKLQLLRDWTNDEAECELHAETFSLESRLHLDSRLHAKIKNAYDSDKYMLTRKFLPTWLVRQSNGLMYAYGTRMYVPNVFTSRSRVLYELHDAPTAGHSGITRLLAAVTRSFWWLYLKRAVQHCVCNYVTCQRNKAARHKPYGLLQSHKVPTMPFEHVSLDLITNLLECDGYCVVVVFVCMLTKRTIVELITKTITTEQLAKVMHRAVFRHFGLPRKWISDRDPRFMSDF
jgi:hypothetical protein